MKRSLILSLVFVAAMVFLCHPVFATGQGDAILGKWLTAGGKSVVEIYKCGDRYCRKIVWLKEPLDKNGKEKLDTKNPDKSKRGRKILGLQILSGFKYEGDNKWGSGRMTLKRARLTSARQKWKGTI